jgi:mRNA-degrading endonuclease RelE of RelBE toxin-antitoxin system
MRTISGRRPKPSWLRGSSRVAARRKRRKADAARPARAPDSASTPDPWRIRYARRILADDIRSIGHAAFAHAKKAIQKKLKSAHVRVAYHIEEEDHEVWVLMIADRNEIWDRHEDAILGRLAVMREEKRQRE